VCAVGNHLNSLDETARSKQPPLGCNPKAVALPTRDPGRQHEARFVPFLGTLQMLVLYPCYILEEV